MAELPVEMPNLLNFPMEKLCYDLVLEVIDELEPKDVPELMKADRRFRGILLQKPARILGKQIHLISVEMDDRENLEDEPKRYHDLVFVMKFAESRPLLSSFMSHKFLLLSQVERCSVLNISDMDYDALDQEKLSARNNFNDFLWNLKAEVTDLATLRSPDLHLELVLSLINGSLQNCKMITVDLYGDSDFYSTVYEALSKTQLELFVTDVCLRDLKSTIEWILNSGIPSENKEAACVVRGEMSVEIYNLIKNFPEIREVNGANKAFIGDTMMETLRKHRFMDNYCDRSRSPRPRSVSVFDDSRSDADDPRSDSDHSRSDSDDSGSDSDDSRSDSEDSRSVSEDSRSACEDSRSDSADSRSDSADSRSDSDDPRSDSDDSRSDSDDSLSVSAESDYCDHSRSPPPAPPRSRSVSVSAESLHSMDRNPMKRGVEHYESLPDSDHSLRSMDRSPIKKRVRHSVSLGGPIDRSPPPRSRPRSVSVSAESLCVSGDSRSDSDDSLHSLDRSPAKRAFDGCHRASVGGPFDCYLKRIDEKRDCIYVVRHGYFFAKYVSSIQF